MTINKNKLVSMGAALIALASVAAPFSVSAADLGGDFSTDWTDTGYYDTYSPSYDTSSYNTPWTDTGYYDTSSPSYDTSTYDTPWTDTGYYDTSNPQDTTCGDYSNPCGSPSSSGSAPSFGGSSGSGYSVPSFGGSSASYPVYTSAANQQYRQQIIPQLPTYAQPQVSNACTNGSCNTSSTYTDNSVYAPSYTDNSVVATCTAVNSCNDNSVVSTPTTVTVTAPTTVTTDSHNQQITYPQPQQQNYSNHSNHSNDYSYNYPTYNQQYQPAYRQPVYQPVYQPAPVAYNTTPYITLSQAPYTGLDLGPFGEVAYWTFLVLWCLGAAYLIVVKRVQNKVVSFLNGFLFGSTSLTTGGSSSARTHTVAYAAPAHKAAAHSVVAEDSIDPFIASQIKRS